VYDHATGSFRDPRPAGPGEVVIVEGLLALATPALRVRFDVAVYLEPEEELRHGWKIHRDCEERGYDIRAVVDDLRGREADADRFVRPQWRFADIVIHSPARARIRSARGRRHPPHLRRGSVLAPGAALNPLLS
jgi:phosphoribulokinase